MNTAIVNLLRGILLSKTMWMNVIAGLAVWLGAHKVIALDPDTQAQLVGGVLVVMNLVLRALTTGSLVDKGTASPALAILLVAGLGLSACAAQQKIDAALASPGAQQAFVLTCSAADLAANTAVGMVQSPSDTARGVAEAAVLIKGACRGPDGKIAAPTSAAELETRLAKIVVEDQYVRAVIAKAIGG